MNCISNTWTGWLDKHWQKPSAAIPQLQVEASPSGCLGRLKMIYEDRKLIYNSKLVRTTSAKVVTKLMYAACFVLFPLVTQKYVNDQANAAFGEMREAKGWKQKIFRPLKTGVLQTVALLNYSWTVVLGVLPIPQYVIIGAVIGVAAGILQGLNQLFIRSRSLEGITEEAFKWSRGFTTATIPSLYGVPRAVGGIFQKAGTLCLIPAYIAGRALICKKSNTE